MAESAAPYMPEKPTLPRLREAAAGCRACPLWETGTQTVFGEGATGAAVVFVGEQPGDQEDRQGRPFVGPAGRVLDEALVEAGIDRGATYVTNAVKHFKWQARGKRRIHAKPNWAELAASRSSAESGSSRSSPSTSPRRSTRAPSSASRTTSRDTGRCAPSSKTSGLSPRFFEPSER